MSRSASASQLPRPRMACWRHGPLSPAASARIQPVLRRSGPSRPSRNAYADAATRSCVNKGRIRSLTSRSDEAHNSNVVSSDAALIHLPSQSPRKVGIKQQIATVVLGCVTESTEPQVDHGSGQVGKAHPTAARFVAAKRDPGGVLEAGERVLDVVAWGVDRRVPRGRVEHPLLGRRVDGASLCGEIGPQFGRDIAAVKGGIGGWKTRQKWADIAQVRVVPGAVNEAQDAAEAIGAGVDLGADPAARAAERFSLWGAVRGARGTTMRLAGCAVGQHQPIGRHHWTEVLEEQLAPATHAPTPPAVRHA